MQPCHLAVDYCHMARPRKAPRKRPTGEIEAYLVAVRRSRGPHAYVSLLGIKDYDTATLHEKVKRGLSFAAFEHLVRLMQLPTGKAAEILLIPARTLHRRKATGRLEADESNRLVRLSRIFGRTLELFEGNQEAALRWLESPATALGGERPLTMSQTEPGALEVERLIGRLEHGVFA